MSGHIAVLLTPASRPQSLSRARQHWRARFLDTPTLAIPLKTPPTQVTYPACQRGGPAVVARMAQVRQRLRYLSRYEISVVDIIFAIGMRYFSQGGRHRATT